MYGVSPIKELKSNAGKDLPNCNGEPWSWGIDI